VDYGRGDWVQSLAAARVPLAQANQRSGHDRRI
jgi:hypothetical protein